MITSLLIIAVLWSIASFVWVKNYMPLYGPEKWWHWFFAPPIVVFLSVLVAYDWVKEKIG